MDAYGVYELFPPGDKYAVAYGTDIIQSIRPAAFILAARMRAGLSSRR